jgi:hypothetical protein
MRNILAITSGILLTACTGFSRTASKPKWAVEGLYVEACQCGVPCPCNFGQKPTHGNCDNTSVYQIQQGNYEEVRLDSLYVVLVGSSPAGERYVDTVGNLTFARYYVDERANPRQRGALEEIARALNASYLRLPTRKLSANEEVKVVSIKADVNADRAEVTIPGVLEFSTRRLHGAENQKPIEILNGAVVSEWMPHIWAGESKTYKYNGVKKWDYSGRSAYFARFMANSDMPSIQASAGASRH